MPSYDIHSTDHWKEGVYYEVNPLLLSRILLGPEFLLYDIRFHTHRTMLIIYWGLHPHLLRQHKFLSNQLTLHRSEIYHLII